MSNGNAGRLACGFITMVARWDTAGTYLGPTLELGGSYVPAIVGIMLSDKSAEFRKKGKDVKWEFRQAACDLFTMISR